jgi:CheY-like chemotaxis protein
VQLVVSDTGEGIPAEQREHIFEPFFSTKEQGKGTGLGLAMVFGFVERSGGHVEVDSQPGAGTTFRLYLPRARQQEQPTAGSAGHPEKLPGGMETILVVDDEPDLLELVQESLQAQGYRVLIAGNAREALELLTTHPGIDLLFSDLVMPGGIDGYELAAQATADRPNLKVLLTSGYTEKVVPLGDHTQHAANLLKKPYRQAELAQRVRLLLGDPQ